MGFGKDIFMPNPKIDFEKRSPDRKKPLCMTERFISGQSNTGALL